MNADPSASWVKAIEERSSLLGRDPVKRMAEIFIEELDTILDAMVTSLQCADMDIARRQAHHLGGNAGSLDFPELTDLALRIEKTCLQGDRNMALSLLQAAVPVAQRNASHLRRHFGIV